MPNDGNIILGVIVDEASLGATQRRLQGLSRNAAINFKVDSASLGRITGQLHDFDRALNASIARTVSFGIAVGALAGVARGVKEITKGFIEVEAQFKNIEVVLGATSKRFEQFKSSVFDVARNTGKGFTETAEAATELARQGLGAEKTIKRLNAALILSRQSGLSTKDSVSDLTAALNTFSKEGLTAVDIVNKLANVDASFAVSSKDLAESIKRSGASAVDAGVSFDKLLAITTSLQQSTARGGSVIGNALKSIFTRVERGGTLDALEQFNVETRDLRGNILSADQVLQNLAKTYKTLTVSERAAITERVAGIQQINQLKALLGDLSNANSIYSRALQESVGTTDEAIERNKLLNQTLLATLNATKVSALEFSSTVGKLVFAPSVEKGASALTAIFGIFKNQDEDTKGIGQKIGEGILSGIGSALSGPGLILGLSVLGNITKKIGSQVFAIIGDYATLNNETTKQKTLQNAINSILSSGNSVYSERLLKATSIRQQEEAIRAIMVEQNALQAVAGARFYGGAQNVVRRGGGVSDSGKLKVPNFANSSYIPNFANPLQAAIAREKSAGIASNQIRIQSSPKLVSSQNPTGLAVINTRDEPGGINQGISRAISEGKDPKTYNVPNFARDSRGRFVKDPISNIGASKNYNPTLDSNFDSSNSDALNIVLKKLAAQDAEISSIQSAIQTKGTLQSSADIALKKANELAEKQKQRLQYVLSQTAGTVGAIAAPIAGQRNINSLGIINPLGITNLGYPANPPAFPKNSALTDYLKQQQQIKQKNIVDDLFRNSGIATSVSRQTSGPADIEGFQQNQRKKLVEENIARQERDAKSARRQQFALGASFGLPVLGGALQATGVLGKQGNSAVNAASTGLTAAAVLGFGPLGIAVGLATAGLLGIKGSADAGRKSLDEYGKELQDVRGKFEENKNSASGIFQLQEQLKDTIGRGGSNKEISNISDRIQELISNIDDSSLRNKIVGASSDDQKRDILTEISAAQAKQVAQAALGGVLEGIIAPKRGILGDKFTDTQNISLEKNQRNDLTNLISNSLNLSNDGKTRSEQLRNLQDLAGRGKGGFGAGLGDLEGVLGGLEVDKNTRKQLQQLDSIELKTIAQQVIQRKLSAEAIATETQNLKSFNSSLLNIGRSLERIQAVTSLRLGLQSIRSEGTRNRAISAASQSLSGISEFLTPEAKNRKENEIAFAQIRNQEIGDREKISTDFVLSLNDLPKDLENAFKKFESDGDNGRGGLSGKSQQLQSDLRQIQFNVADKAANPTDSALDANRRLDNFKNILGKKENADLIKAIEDFQQKGLTIPTAELTARNQEQRAAQEQTNAINKNTIALQKSAGFFGGGTFESDVDTSKISAGSNVSRLLKNNKTNPFRNRIKKSRGDSFSDFFSGQVIDEDAEADRRAATLKTLAAGRLQASNLGFFDNPRDKDKTRNIVAAAEEAGLTSQINKLKRAAQNSGDLDLLDDLRKQTPDKIKQTANLRALKAVPGEGFEDQFKIKGSLENLNKIFIDFNDNFEKGIKGNFDKLSKSAADAAEKLLSLSNAGDILSRFSSEKKINDKQSALLGKKSELQTKLEDLRQKRTANTRPRDLLRPENIIPNGTDLRTFNSSADSDIQEKELIRQIKELQVSIDNLGVSNKSSGFLPSYAGGIFGAFKQEKRDINAGVGGARAGDKPYLTNLKGIGPAVVNSGEKIIRNYAGGGKDAVLNRKMMNFAGGLTAEQFEILQSDPRAQEGLAIKNFVLKLLTKKNLGLAEKGARGVGKSAAINTAIKKLGALGGGGLLGATSTGFLTATLEPIVGVFKEILSGSSYEELSENLFFGEKDREKMKARRLAKNLSGGFIPSYANGYSEYEQIADDFKKNPLAYSNTSQIFDEKFKNQTNIFRSQFKDDENYDGINISERIATGGSPFQSASIQSSGGLQSGSLQGSQRFNSRALTSDERESKFRQTRNSDNRNLGRTGQGLVGPIEIKQSSVNAIADAITRKQEQGNPAGGVDVKNDINVSVSGNIDTNNEKVKEIVDAEIANFKERTEARLIALEKATPNRQVVPPKSAIKAGATFFD